MSEIQDAIEELESAVRTCAWHNSDYYDGPMKDKTLRTSLSALRAQLAQVSEDVQKAINHYEYKVNKRREDITFYRNSHNQELILAADTLERALSRDEIILTALRCQIDDGWIKAVDQPPTKADGVGKLEEVLIYTDGKPNPIPWHCIAFCPEGYGYWRRIPEERKDVG